MEKQSIVEGRTFNDYISKQATINIGTIGHVAHGKSTLVKAITGLSTVKFKKEKEKNMTIKLGYANAKIYQCENPFCQQRYSSRGSQAPDEFPCEICNQRQEKSNQEIEDEVEEVTMMRLVRHISFVDTPGHEVLMSTMMNGVSVMDAAILLIAANEPCPQPQTVEHFQAINQLNNVVVVQNKVDLVSEERAIENHQAIKSFLKNGRTPIIPISAQRQINIDCLLEHIVTRIPIPVRDLDSPARMTIVRSFDVNRPACKIDDLKGGVAGGSLLRGTLKLNDEIEIRPGIIYKDFTCQPIITNVISLCSEENDLSEAIPGGLIAVGTSMDPILSKSDRLVGQVLGLRGTLPVIYCELEICYLLHDGFKRIKKNERILINILSNSVETTVFALKADLCKMRLSKPICCDLETRLSLSRKIAGKWRLIGHGLLLRGRQVTMQEA